MDHAFRSSDNSYRNMVAACRTCNSRKHSQPADAFLRRLYQEGFLHAADFRRRLARLHKLRRGQLKPAA
jgi:5-methylcytosine-specific restriction endonuclease McrA